MLQKFDKIIVLNKKDYDLLIKEKIKKPIEIHYPKISDEFKNLIRMKQNIEQFSIIFWGAMYRFENQDAVKWFIEDIFPDILKHYSKSKFYIVGSNPPEKINKLGSKNIVVTGFVENPLEYFRKAQVAVVPLRYGAGITIKTLELTAARIPTISTYIGMEGVRRNEYLHIANSKEEFVKKILEIFEEQ